MTIIAHHILQRILYFVIRYNYKRKECTLIIFIIQRHTSYQLLSWMMSYTAQPLFCPVELHHSHWHTPQLNPQTYSLGKLYDQTQLLKLRLAEREREREREREGGREEGGREGEREREREREKEREREHIVLDPILTILIFIYSSHNVFILLSN